MGNRVRIYTHIPRDTYPTELEKLVEAINERLSRLAQAVEGSWGGRGEIQLANSIDLDGNGLKNLKDPDELQDAVTLAHLQRVLSGASIVELLRKTPAFEKLVNDLVDLDEIEVDGDLDIGGDINLEGDIGARLLKLFEDPANGENFVGLKAPDSLDADTTYTLPEEDGDEDDVLSTDGSGNLSWVPQSASGGASGIWWPEKRPETSQSTNFDGNSEPTWSDVNWAGHTTADVNSTKLHAQYVLTPTSGSGTIRARLQADPSGDFTLYTKLSIRGASAASHLAGLILTDGTTDATGNQALCAFGTVGSAIFQWAAFKYTGFATFSATLLTAATINDLATNPNDDLYLRLRRSSTTYTFAYSFDGRLWTAATLASLGFTPTHFGIAGRNASGSDHEVVWEFFHYHASAAEEIGGTI